MSRELKVKSAYIDGELCALPQLTRLVDEAAAGDGWLHEIKYDGYRMHAAIAPGANRHGFGQTRASWPQVCGLNAAATLV